MPGLSNTSQSHITMRRRKKSEGGNWRPGDSPALTWSVEALAKAGTLSIVGVYPDQSKSFPIGIVMNKNLTIKQGNSHHSRYIPELLKWVRSPALDTSEVLTQVEPMTSVLEAYKAFDRRGAGMGSRSSWSLGTTRDCRLKP